MNRTLSSKHASGIAVILAASFLFALSINHYLIFHSFAEIASVGISLTIFVIIVNSSDYLINHYLKIVGLAYLFIAILDILHTLSYEGMLMFEAQHYYANQLWIATRFFEAVVMLIAFLSIGRIKSKTVNQTLIIAIYAGITALVILSIFIWKIFPQCFVQGVGLTKFKIYSEYVICTIFAVNLLLLNKKRQSFTQKVFVDLRASFVFYIISELSFTLYISNFGFTNIIGHFAKLVAFYFSYKAIVQTSIKEPYDLIFKELNEKNHMLEQMNKTKDRVFSIIGHDLRGPISSIKSGIDLTLSEVSDQAYEDIEKYLLMMRTTSETTLDLLDNLLLWARSQNNSMEVNKEQFQMDELIADCIKILDESAKHKSIEILHRKNIEFQYLVNADRFMISAVIRNLLNNAIKFTNNGGQVQIITKLVRDKLEVRIKDNGIGMDKDHTDKLFDFNTNISTRGTNGEKGTGLGLVLCREFVEKNGGDLRVESEIGKGTTFIIVM